MKIYGRINDQNNKTRISKDKRKKKQKKTHKKKEWKCNENENLIFYILQRTNSNGF